MSKFSRNVRKNQFIDSLPTTSIDNCDIASRSKFNFSFFDHNQEHASNFEDLTNERLIELLEKIKAFSNHSLDYWTTQRCGAGSLKILEMYGAFPKKSGFVHPKHVPHDILWGRFRLDNMTRLVGFRIPNEKNGTFDEKQNFRLDTNTFYIVFVDLEHKFYLTEKK